jgi:hypothetical protein
LAGFALIKNGEKMKKDDLYYSGRLTECGLGAREIASGLPDGRVGRGKSLPCLSFLRKQAPGFIVLPVNNPTATAVPSPQRGEETTGSPSRTRNVARRMTVLAEKRRRDEKILRHDTTSV